MSSLVGRILPVGLLQVSVALKSFFIEAKEASRFFVADLTFSQSDLHNLLGDTKQFTSAWATTAEYC